MLKAIKYLFIFGIFFLPFAVAKSLAFPLVYSHLVFIFTLIELTFLLFVLYSIERGEIVIKKGVLVPGLLFYIAIMFLTAFTGLEFKLSFWSSYLRSTGIITWLHFFGFFIMASSVFNREEDWKRIFRALALSGLLLAVLSFLGVNGFNLKAFSFLEKGGSFLGNTSYSGAYLLLVFFLSLVGLSMESNKTWKATYLISMALIFFHPDLFNFAVWRGGNPFIEGFKNPILLVGVARTSSIILWAGILLIPGIFLLHKLKDKKKTIMGGTILLVVLFSVYGYGFMALMNGHSKLHNFYVENSGPVRPMVWQIAINGIKERPLLGYGDGNFKYVYDKYMPTEMIHLENPPWFDRAHNFTLEEILGHGIIGALGMFFLFIGITYISFRQYIKNKNFYFLFIPFIFFLHFLQLQTFFQTDSALLLCFLILAFLLYREGEWRLKIPWKNKTIFQGGVALAMLLVFIFAVYFPIQENRLILLIKNTKTRAPRIGLLEKMQNINIDPAETLRQTSLKFMDETALRAEELQKGGYTENVAEEYDLYLKAYEKNYPRYAGSHRYNFEYANVINSAHIFGTGDLKRGEELAKHALELSDKYPYAYWILAVNLYYQGKTDEAIKYAQAIYDLDPTIPKSKNILDTLSANRKSGKVKQFFYVGN